MGRKTTLALIVAVAAMFAAPQASNAAPQLGDAKQVTKSNIEKAGYRHHHGYYGRRHWRHRHYYGHRHYYRRPGFGIYLGF